MSEPKRKRGRERVYDLQRTREAILNAAEAVFAEQGFDGTAVDVIAARAGYAKSLLFQYFGDKLGLYTQVLKRADQEMGELLAQSFVSWQQFETADFQADQFRVFLATMVRTLFDYLIEHPRLVRMLTWEMAENWQTFAQIASQFPPQETAQFEPLFHKARSAGLLRSDFVPTIQLTMMVPICQVYLAYLPLYQRFLPDVDLSSARGQARVREYLVDFVVAGILNDFPETKVEKG
ncbi:MAG TPA: TetR family transcriptional regulator [Ktedonobacteraceae bacterium]|nr:TetR family transcriptional regulator [Ktedonobacteraceae bacterium]